MKKFLFELKIALLFFVLFSGILYFPRLLLTSGRSLFSGCYGVVSYALEPDSQNNISQLEHLWKKAVENNIELLSIENEVFQAEKSLKYKESLFPVSLSTDISSGFTDEYEKVLWCPESSSFDLSVSKKNPAGNAISASLSYSLSRGFINFFEEADSDNLGYFQVPSATISVKQSFCPFFFQGETSEPETSILREKLKSARLSSTETKKTLIENVTFFYIQWRYYERLVKKQEAFLSYYDEVIENSLEMVQKGQKSRADFWSAENSRSSVFDNFIEYTSSRDSAFLNLKNALSLCGEEIELSTEVFLPDSAHNSAVSCSEASETAFPLSSTSFSESDIEASGRPVSCSSSFSSTDFSENPDENPTLSKIQSQKELLRLQSVLDKQNHAPALFLSGSIYESLKQDASLVPDFVKNKSALGWKFSMGITFDEFFSPSRKLRSEILKNNEAFLQKNYSSAKALIENQMASYEKLILSCKMQLEKAEKLHQNHESLLKNYEKLFQAGKCSQSELEEIALQALESNCVYENLKDYLWLYEWRLAQCRK